MVRYGKGKYSITVLDLITVLCASVQDYCEICIHVLKVRCKNKISK